MEFTAKNTGKSVKINHASFRDALTLKKETMKCLQNAGIIGDVEFDKVKTMDTSDMFSVLSNLLITMDTSESFEKAVFDCLKVCIYDNKHAITTQLFEDIPELQEDYYEIVSSCCEVNLRPFFKSLSTALETRFNLQDANIQKQELKQNQNS